MIFWWELEKPEHSLMRNSRDWLLGVICLPCSERVEILPELNSGVCATKRPSPNSLVAVPPSLWVGLYFLKHTGEVFPFKIEGLLCLSVTLCRRSEGGERSGWC